MAQRGKGGGRWRLQRGPRFWRESGRRAGSECLFWWELFQRGKRDGRQFCCGRRKTPLSEGHRGVRCLRADRQGGKTSGESEAKDTRDEAARAGRSASKRKKQTPNWFVAFTVHSYQRQTSSLYHFNFLRSSLDADHAGLHKGLCQRRGWKFRDEHVTLEEVGVRNRTAVNQLFLFPLPLPLECCHIAAFTMAESSFGLRNRTRRVSSQRDPSPEPDDDHFPQQDPVRWTFLRTRPLNCAHFQSPEFPHPSRSPLGVS
jgi:hypothetical protein